MMYPKMILRERTPGEWEETGRNWFPVMGINHVLSEAVHKHTRTGAQIIAIRQYLFIW